MRLITLSPTINNKNEKKKICNVRIHTRTRSSRTFGMLKVQLLDSHSNLLREREDTEMKLIHCNLQVRRLVHMDSEASYSLNSIYQTPLLISATR